MEQVELGRGEAEVRTPARVLAVASVGAAAVAAGPMHGADSSRHCAAETLPCCYTSPARRLTWATSWRSRMPAARR